MESQRIVTTAIGGIPRMRPRCLPRAAGPLRVRTAHSTAELRGLDSELVILGLTQGLALRRRTRHYAVAKDLGAKLRCPGCWRPAGCEHANCRASSTRRGLGALASGPGS